MKNITRKELIASSAAAVLAIAIAIGGIYAYNVYQTTALKNNEIDASAQKSYDTYTEKYNDIMSKLEDDSTHDDLVAVITELNKLYSEIDKNSFKLHDGNYFNNADIMEKITSSISDLKARLIKSYNDSFGNTVISDDTIGSAAKDQLNSAIENLNTLKGTIAADKTTLEGILDENDTASIDEIVSNIDNKVGDYTNRISELDKKEAEEKATAEASANAGNTSGGSGSGSYSGGGYSSGYRDGGYSGGSSSSGGYTAPDGTQLHYNSNYDLYMSDSIDDGDPEVPGTTAWVRKYHPDWAGNHN